MFRRGLRAALSAGVSLPPAGCLASLLAAKASDLPLKLAVSCHRCPGGVPAGAMFSFSSKGLTDRKAGCVAAGFVGLQYTVKASKLLQLGAAACASEADGRPISDACLKCNQ